MEFSKEELMLLLSALVTVIGILWKLIQTKDKAAQKERDQFKEDQAERLKRAEEINEKAHEEVLKITKEHYEMKGRMDGVENLSKSVLKAIDEATSGNKSSKDS